MINERGGVGSLLLTEDKEAAQTRDKGIVWVTDEDFDDSASRVTTATLVAKL